MTARTILICLHDFARGGTERIAIGLAASWVEMGRDVTILCGSEQGGLRDTVNPRVKVMALAPPIPRSLLSRFWLGRAMARQLEKRKPDVIFLPGNFHFLLAPALRRADPRAVIVLKISNPLLPQGLSSLAGRFLFRRLAGAINGFAALTAEFARDVAGLAPGRPVRVLHDPVYLHPSSAQRVAPRGTFRILWAGRLEPQKDFGLALQTMAVLTHPAHLTMLGDGSLRDQADAMIARLGLWDRVTRAGHVPNIDPYLADADVLLMTSHYEGQPAVVGEALANGVPVVSTDCSSMLHDVLSIPEAGKIVTARDPADLAAALTAVCSAPRPSRDVLARLVAPFEPRHCAKAYLDWFDALVKQRHG
ncbi:MAG TPA: glycosyltransferase [Rhizomicrobium sp.]|nr:glycosyltransferase [Rhizomicrobium sp.]